MRYSLLFSIAALSFYFCGCSSQAWAYEGSPICKQRKQKYEAYQKARKKAHGDKGDALKWMREDYEATERACAESVRTLQESSAPPSPGKPPRY
jgi:hypothetical protein